MKQDIENIIKKNLPEKKGEVSWLNEDATGGYNIALDEINTSLIADEVLKVVVDKLNLEFKANDYYRGNPDMTPEEIINLLSEHLSLNKENENNER